MFDPPYIVFWISVHGHNDGLCELIECVEAQLFIVFSLIKLTKQHADHGVGLVRAHNPPASPEYELRCVVGVLLFSAGNTGELSVVNMDRRFNIWVQRRSFSVACTGLLLLLPM